MTIDPRKIRRIADVCSVLATSAPTAEEHDLFADLASKWSRLALDRSRLATDLERFDDDGGAQSLKATAEVGLTR
jgi:hypothetical protein